KVGAVGDVAPPQHLVGLVMLRGGLAAHSADLYVAEEPSHADIFAMAVNRRGFSGSSWTTRPRCSTHAWARKGNNCTPITCSAPNPSCRRNPNNASERGKQSCGARRR